MIGCGVTIGKDTVVRDSIIMNGTVIGDGCELNKAIVAEKAIIGNNVKLGIGEEVENETDPHIYNHGIATVGEKSVIPDGITVVRIPVYSEPLLLRIIRDNCLASGKTLIIKAGDEK